MGKGFWRLKLNKREEILAQWPKEYIKEGYDPTTEDGRRRIEKRLEQIWNDAQPQEIYGDESVSLAEKDAIFVSILYAWVGHMVGLSNNPKEKRSPEGVVKRIETSSVKPFNWVKNPLGRIPNIFQDLIVSRAMLCQNQKIVNQVYAGFWRKYYDSQYGFVQKLLQKWGLAREKDELDQEVFEVAASQLLKGVYKGQAPFIIFLRFAVMSAMKKLAKEINPSKLEPESYTEGVAETRSIIKEALKLLSDRPEEREQKILALELMTSGHSYTEIGEYLYGQRNDANRMKAKRLLEDTINEMKNILAERNS